MDPRDVVRVTADRMFPGQPGWGLLFQDLADELGDLDYTLQVREHMKSYAAQDEVRRIIYLALNRRGVPVSLQDAAWSGYHDLAHVVDGRTDDEYVQNFIPTIDLERACDIYGLREAIKFFERHDIPHTLTGDSWRTVRYSSPLHVAQWLEGFNGGRGFEQLDARQVHCIADALGISWDNDPRFMEMSRRATGKEHLDDMDRDELWLTVQAMLRRILGRAPMVKESASRLLHSPGRGTTRGVSRFKGVGRAKDEDGWYVKTHRARSKSYLSLDDIPDSVIKRIESTG